MRDMKICIIMNPKSGLANRWFGSTPLEDIVGFFAEQNMSINIKTTAKQGDGIRLSEEAVAQGYTHIIACGGDGTLNEVANGIAEKDAVFGIIPLGTENVLAKAFGVPLDVVGACRHFLQSSEKKMDMGVANGRNYIIMSGIGFDAKVVSEMDLELKKTLGSVGFILKGAWHLLADDGVKNPRAKIRLFDTGEEYEYPAWFIVVGNLAHYSGTIKLALNAKFDDGKLDILVFPNSDALDMVKQIIGALTETHLQIGNIPYFTSSDFEIITDPPLLCHIDGELLGETPVHYQVKPGALTIRF